jgi:hypothetical protein
MRAAERKYRPTVTTDSEVIYRVHFDLLFSLTYQLNALHVIQQPLYSDMFRHNHAHHQEVHAKFKTINSKMDYVYEFHNHQYMLLLKPFCM